MYYGYYNLIGGMLHIVGWILFALFIAWIVRSFQGRHHSRWCDGNNCKHPAHGNRALDLLKERYAKGEIDTAEFEEKKKNLS